MVVRLHVGKMLSVLVNILGGIENLFHIKAWEVLILSHRGKIRAVAWTACEIV